MSILITGAAGFIGQELTLALLSADADARLLITDVVEPSVDHIPSSQHARVTSTKLDLTSPSLIDIETLLKGTRLSAAYLLHGIMSSGAEANLAAGYAVNLHSFLTLASALSITHPGLVTVFPSSLAVYGPAVAGEVNTELTTPLPQSSYGTQKLMVEALLNDYSRRGLLDARVCRLPTVLVRPGRPTAAASSFASGIVRESLKGVRNVLPVAKELEMWVCSPRTVVRNLVHAKSVPHYIFGLSRVVNLPGRTVTVAQILDAVQAVGGTEARECVVEERDAVIENIVESWPARFDTSQARDLGFVDDVSLMETVQVFADGLRKH